MLAIAQIHAYRVITILQLFFVCMAGLRCF
jgi:hypothetical protein